MDKTTQYDKLIITIDRMIRNCSVAGTNCGSYLVGYIDAMREMKKITFDEKELLRKYLDKKLKQMADKL